MNKKHPFYIPLLPSVKQLIKQTVSVSALSLILFFGLFATLLVATNNARANDEPAIIVEKTINVLLVEFAKKRDHFQENNRDLFELVNRVASPLFDFDYIAKLVLAKNWKKASAQQRKAFAHEFKRLIIVTYATALFQYTGNETVKFSESDIKERKRGVRTAKVNTTINLGEGGKIPVIYALIQKGDHPQWKIHNLTVGRLNMVLNYRNIIQASIRSGGLEEMIANLKSNNDKNY